ncbi:MAG: CPCC family cysteine-rich protein [Anaerovoracaceae bacterium]|jgi:hypothetical protein
MIEHKSNKIKCPVCGKYYFNARASFEICPVCNWENDPLQYDCPNEDGGANQMSLNQARAAWKKGEKVI